MDEAQLVENARTGQPEALEALVRVYQKPIYNYIYRMTGNFHDAQDLTQETFMRVCSSIQAFKGKAPFSSWVYRIASNLCIDRSRRRQRRPAVSLDAPVGQEELAWQLPDEAPGPDRQAEVADLGRAIQRGLDRLSREHRTVIVLHDMRQLTYGEIAGILQCPVGTVKSRLSRARAALRDVLAEQGIFHHWLPALRPLAVTG
ncbi:MAG: sigma-70 family RNA polymerase sigma factor [Bacillota bacterium]